MATAVKKTAAPKRPTDRPRKAVARKPVQDIPMPDVDVLDLHSEDATEDEPDLVEIFRLDGKPYYFDRNIGVGVSLRMLKALRTEGENAAVSTMLFELLGEQALDDLAKFPGVRPKHLAQILLACQKAVLGDENTGPKA